MALIFYCQKCNKGKSANQLKGYVDGCPLCKECFKKQNKRRCNAIYR